MVNEILKLKKNTHFVVSLKITRSVYAYNIYSYALSIQKNNKFQSIVKVFFSLPQFLTCNIIEKAFPYLFYNLLAWQLAYVYWVSSSSIRRWKGVTKGDWRVKSTLQLFSSLKILTYCFTLLFLPFSNVKFCIVLFCLTFFQCGRAFYEDCRQP